MDESVPSAVNLFQLPAVQAAFAATATQEDSLLGGGSLLQEACGPLQHADSAGLLGYDVQGAADRNIKTLGSLGVQREVCGCYHSGPDQHGHRQGDEGGQLARAVHPAETLLQAAVSPVTDWHFECHQLVYEIFVATVSKAIFCCYC